MFDLEFEQFQTRNILKEHTKVFGSFTLHHTFITYDCFFLFSRSYLPPYAHVHTMKKTVSQV